jgi:predicted ATPase/DNA-binding XRE family transcriptional regulator
MDTDGRPSFGELLKTTRLARGLSQEALAERAGLSREAISLLERGGRLTPHRDTIALLSRSLELSPAERVRLEASLAERQRPVGLVGTARHETAALPVRLTSFVGREREIAEIRELLLHTRLLTLTGPGGIGKTSLVVQLAAALSAQIPGGVWLVELATLTDPGLVPHVLASTLGVREKPGQPILTTLVKAIGKTQRLVILDNCEHLLERCGHTAEALLQACSGVRILVTSRSPLRIGPEVVWRVPALTLPPPSDAGRQGLHPEDGRVENPPSASAFWMQEAGGAESVRLFVERAGAVRPGFALAPSNAHDVGEICRRLDGIPLAIELAAARVAALTPEQIARHLNNRFGLLTNGSRTALPRHRTLLALFDWSHELLADKERVLFRRLAVFAGSWTLEAAEAVCQERGSGMEGVEPPPPYPVPDPVSADEVLGLLLELVDRSLVLVEERGGENRYRLLETLREYARSKLDDSGETQWLKAKHAVYFAVLMGGPGAQPVEEVIERVVALPLGSVEREADNLRAALTFFIDRDDAEAGLRLAARIYHLWNLRGPREEGLEWLRRFLAAPAAAPAPSRTAALFAAGWLATHQGDVAEAHAAFAEAAVLAQGRGDRAGWAYAQTKLGAICAMRGENLRARSELEKGAQLAREGDAPVALLESLVHLGYLGLMQGDLVWVREVLAEAREVLPRFPATAFRINWLAGDLAMAERHVHLARREYQAGLADRWADRDPLGVSVSTLGLADVAAAACDGNRAARLLGASEGLAMGVGNQSIPEPEPVRRAQHARVEAAARKLLGEEAFVARRAEGRRLGLEEVAPLALADTALLTEIARAPLPSRRDVKRA